MNFRILVSVDKFWVKKLFFSTRNFNIEAIHETHDKPWVAKLDFFIYGVRIVPLNWRGLWQDVILKEAMISKSPKQIWKLCARCSGLIGTLVMRVSENFYMKLCSLLFLNPFDKKSVCLLMISDSYKFSSNIINSF